MTKHNMRSLYLLGIGIWVSTSSLLFARQAEQGQAASGGTIESSTPSYGIGLQLGGMQSRAPMWKNSLLRPNFGAVGFAAAYLNSDLIYRLTYTHGSQDYRTSAPSLGIEHRQELISFAVGRSFTPLGGWLRRILVLPALGVAYAEHRINAFDNFQSVKAKGTALGPELSTELRLPVGRKFRFSLGGAARYMKTRIAEYQIDGMDLSTSAYLGGNYEF